MQDYASNQLPMEPKEKAPIDKNRPCAAFTMIEIIMMLMMIGLTVMIVGPNFSRHLNHWHLEQDVQRIKIMFRAARQSAITESDFKVMELEITGPDYRDYRLCDADEAGNCITETEKRDLSEGVEFLQICQLSPFKFDALGNFSGGAGRIRLINEAGTEEACLLITAETGKIDTLDPVECTGVCP